MWKHIFDNVPFICGRTHLLPLRFPAVMPCKSLDGGAKRHGSTGDASDTGSARL